MKSSRMPVLMAAGLTLRDPARFDLRGVLRAGRDTEIDVDVVIEGRVILGDNVFVGPHVVLKNCRIENDTRIESHSVVEGATIGARCAIGPFARLRPDTVVADRAKIGNFVETKKSSIGEGSKVNHLTYIGDSRVGKDVNVGAGTITCNYDGANKHRTTLGEGVFVGSNSTLVAPLVIESGGFVAAGSTVTDDVKADQLAVARGRQRNVDGWQRPEKPGDSD